MSIYQKNFNFSNLQKAKNCLQEMEKRALGVTNSEKSREFIIKLLNRDPIQNKQLDIYTECMNYILIQFKILAEAHNLEL